MSILNIACTICTEVFQNSDEIHSTSCGHIFHFNCLRNWQSCSTTCPQCRLNNPTTHKLYLSFDSSDNRSTDTKELQVKLQKSSEKIQTLYDQINEGDANFLRLQEQCYSSGEIIKVLKRRISQTNDSERNFLHLQAQYNEAENLIKELRDNIQLLTSDNETKLKELSLKSLEITTIKNCETSLADQIKILEQKITELLAQSYDSDKNLLHLHRKYKESEDLIKELQENKKLLLDMKSLEIAKLKMSETNLNHKIKVLDKKLHMYSSDFGREIKISSICLLIAIFVMIYNQIQKL